MPKDPVYDEIGKSYSLGRVPDSRWYESIREALGGANRIVNVGAGTGSYEPDDAQVLAIEPSPVMIAQRPASAAPVIRATAEHLPVRNEWAEVSMALLSLHHWSDWRAGLRELGRVAPRRVVLTYDPVGQGEFWLVRDYLPEVAAFDEARVPSIDAIAEILGGEIEVRNLMIPWDTTDGVLPAHWRRPRAYLSPLVRSFCSGLSQSDQVVVERGIAALARDLDDGSWNNRYGSLLDQETYDAGFRIVISNAE